MISRRVHPTARAEVPYGTVGEFLTDYLAEMDVKSRSLATFRQRQRPFFGLSVQAWGSVLLYIVNLLAHFDSTGWGGANNSNKN